MYQDVKSNEAVIQHLLTDGLIIISIILMDPTALLLFTYSGGIVMIAVNEFDFEFEFESPM
jgi:hypothetical protein